MNTTAKFDDLVKEYSGWVISLKEPEKIQKYEKDAFYRGFMSVFFGFTRFPAIKDYDPISSKKDLTNSQKNFIYRASSLQRIEQKLDEVIDGKSKQYSIEEANIAKPFIKNMYENYKKLFYENKSQS